MSDSYVKCPSCQVSNMASRTRCRICGARLHVSDERAKQLEEEKKKMEEEKEKMLAAERAHAEELSKILISSGFNFEGYRIVKYSGYISGDDVTTIPRSSSALGISTDGNMGSNLTDALVKIRIQALKELKEAAYALGCNAVIGVDFDYITLEPETVAALTNTRILEPYVICVTANGNAVVIEKE